MPLPVIEIRDVTPMFRQMLDSVVIPATTTTAAQSALGFDIAENIGGDDSGFRDYGFDVINDRLGWYINTRITSPTQQGIRNGVMVFDSQGNDGSAARAGFVDGNTLGQSVPRTAVGSLFEGQPHLEISQQVIYGVNGGSGPSVFDYDSLTFGPSIFPNIGSAVGGTLFQSTTAAGVIGRYTSNPDAATTGRNALFFEGMTDTTGYDEIDPSISSNNNQHALGLALVRCDACNLEGSDSDHTESIAWIDIDLGVAVGFMDVPSIVDNGDSGSPTSEPLIDGKVFAWDRLQFVPDPDSLFGNPKGELHCYSSQISGRFNVSIPETGGAGRRTFVTVYDFNPFGLTTGTTRVHNRRVFLGIIDVPTDPIITGGQNITNTDESTAIKYHAPSRTYFNYIGAIDNTSGNLNTTPETNDWVIQRWRRTFVPETVVAVVPESEVTENATIKYRAVVLTDLHVPAGGVAMTMSQSRVSTRAESFDGTAQGATDFIVEAAEIDETGVLTVTSENDIDNGGIPFTDFVVDFATGTLNPNASWPTELMFVRYRHLNVPLSPGHGQLLSTATSTDANGEATVEVVYGDNLDGEFNRIDFTTV